MSSVLRRIAQKLSITKQDHANRLIVLSHVLKLPFLTALAWRLFIEEMEEVQQNRKSKKRILIISKSGGLEDVTESFAGSTIDAKVDLISRSVFKKSANYYLKDQVGDINYVTDDPEIEKNKVKYRQFIKTVLKHFRKLYGCDVIIQFNYFYFAEREVAAACSELGIRFLTAHKECLNSEPMKEYKIQRLNKNFGKYDGYKISVYNESQKDVIVESGFADPTRVEITGCPRLNASYRKRETEPEDDGKITLLYYVIHDEAGLPIYKIDENGKNYRGIEKNGRVSTWAAMVEEVNSSILKIAENNPDLRVILKTKTGVRKKQVGYFNVDALPNNVDLISGGVGHNLLDDAHIVVGFNSTAVLEAMAAGRVTVVPFFKNLLNPEIYPWAIDLGDSVIIADSKENFESIIQSALNKAEIKKQLLPNQVKILDKYLGNGDEMAGVRYRNFILDALNTDPQEVIYQLNKP